MWFARRRAGLTAENTADAVGVPVDIIDLAEAGRPLADEAVAAAESVIAVLR